MKIDEGYRMLRRTLTSKIIIYSGYFFDLGFSLIYSLFVTFK